MSEILLYYRRPDPTTWVYLSSFLTIGLFFVFHRFWSIRNLDVVLLILLAPGLLMVYEGRRRQLTESEILQSEMLMLESTEGGGEPEGGQSEKARPPDATDPSNFPTPSTGLDSSLPVEQQSDAEQQSDTAQGALGARVKQTRPQSQRPRLPGSRLPGSPLPGPPLVLSEASSKEESDWISQTSFIEMTKAVGGSLVGFVSQAIDGKQDGDSSDPVSSSRRLKQGGEDSGQDLDTDLSRVVSSDSAKVESDTTGLSGGEFILDEDLAGNLDRVDDDSSFPQMDEVVEESWLSRLLRGPEDPRELQRWGFVSLFIVESLLLLRLMLDPLMVRRPMLDPNLTTGGLYFIGVSLFIFMMANVVTSSPRVQVQQGPELGPGYAMMNLLPAIPTRPISDQPGGVIPPRVSELTPQQLQLAKIAKTLAILAQFSIVVGIVLIGSRHFSNVRAGVGCSLLYLLLPYTAQMTGRVDHVLPAALLLWAVLCYRRPVVAGIFLGLAGGLVYYPLFLLPLWGSFYWRRGARKFAAGVAAMLILLMIALSFDSSASLSDHLYRMFGLLKPNRDPQEFRGIWALGWNPMWRLPVIVGFAILAAFFSIWPARKNLGTLMSSSAALMVAAQFWHGYGGGLYIAWFMPLLLLVIFRPNLQDRIAAKVVVGASPAILLGETETEPA